MEAYVILVYIIFYFVWNVKNQIGQRSIMRLRSVHEGELLFQPHLEAHVTGHAKVAPGRKADAAYLGTVGNTVAFELLGEELSQEGGELAIDLIGVVNSVKGLAGQKAELGRVAAPS